MEQLRKFKKQIAIFVVFAVIISGAIITQNKSTVNAQINELNDFKNSYEEEMNKLKLEDFNEEYDTYMDWLNESIANNYVHEGTRVKGLLEELKDKVIDNNEELYNSKYEEINSLDINELEEEIKNDINSKRDAIEESRSSNNYKDAIEALDSLKEDISNSLLDMQKKKEEEAAKQREEQAKLEEEKKNESTDVEAENNDDSSAKGSKHSSSDEGSKSNGQGAQSTTAGSYVKNLKVASRTNQLVIVKGQGGSSATVEFHKKSSNGVWTEVFSTSGYVGQNGITYNKREGDRKTPAGVYGFGTGFGVAQNPGANISYRVINNDDCWVDDSNSSHYNTWCSMRAPDKDWNSAEHMINFTDAYRYGIVIEYNTYDRVPGKGSGIFLHCKTSPTPGCVAIDSNYMVTLLQQINSNALIVIAPSEGELYNY